MDKLSNEIENAKRLPTEGETIEGASQHESVEQVRRDAAQGKADAKAARDPGSDPRYREAARKNEEFVKDVAGRYDKAEERSARGDSG